MTVVGFDFGTTNSLISVVVGDRVVDVVDDATGLPFPSVVRYEGNQTIVGADAKKSLDVAGLGIHGNVVRSPKFLLGEESVHVGGVERSPIDIVHDVVSHVKAESLRGSRGKNLHGVEKAVVTIPVDMNGRRRAALRDAFRKADIGIVQFVHEPLAALYGYFRSHENMESAQREYDRRNILVVDWGGGTLDLTLCRLQSGRLTQLRNSGTDEVGGDRFDEAIRNAVIHRFSLQHEEPNALEPHPDARTQLLHDTERHKIALSTDDSVTFYRPGFYRSPELDLEYVLSRKEMEEITAHLVQSGMNRITTLLDGASINSSQISLCLVTGGMAAMPAIRTRLHELFGPQRVVIAEQSATLIAQGAAWIAHDKQPLHLARSIELQLARGSYLSLIRKGTEVPFEGDVKRDAFHLYCLDPRDGHAKFDLCTADTTSDHPQKSDHRSPIGSIVVKVDPRANLFHERLELEVSLNDDLVLRAAAKSSDLLDRDETEVHDLEFGLSLPVGVAGSGHGDASPRSGRSSHARTGDLVIRANITDTDDLTRVPGEVLHQYRPLMFDRRVGKATETQIREFLYYQPCAVCKRRSSDPSCRCISGHRS